MASDSISPVNNVAALQSVQKEKITNGAAMPEGGEGKRTAIDGKLFPPDSSETAEDPKDVEAAVSQLSEYVQNYQRDIRFNVDQQTGRTVIKVIDSLTEKVIRQIPAEYVLKLVQRLDSLESLMLEDQA